MTIVVILGAIALVTATIWLIHRTAVNPGDRAAPRRDRSLRPAPDRFAPGEVLPRTPQAGEPLTPLPEPDETPDAFAARFYAAMADPKPPVVRDEPEPAPALANGNGHHTYDELAAGFDQLTAAYDDHMDAFARKLDTRDGWLLDELHKGRRYHTDNASLVESMAHHALTPDLLAALDKAKAEGQVHRG